MTQSKFMGVDVEVGRDAEIVASDIIADEAVDGNQPPQGSFVIGKRWQRQNDDQTCDIFEWNGTNWFAVGGIIPSGPIVVTELRITAEAPAISDDGGWIVPEAIAAQLHIICAPAEPTYEQRREETARRRNRGRISGSDSDIVRVKIRMPNLFMTGDNPYLTPAQNAGEMLSRANAASDARQSAPIMSALRRGHEATP